MAEAAEPAKEEPKRSSNGSSEHKSDAVQKADMAAADADRSASETDQTLADVDQTLSDSDQTGSESDQAQADRDQRSSDRDQDAADRERSMQKAPSERYLEASAISRAEREKSSAERTVTAEDRALTALERAEAAKRRDQQASLRDLQAALRDRTAEVRDRMSEEQPPGGVGSRAFEIRAAAIEDRANAAKDRERAARDREKAAADRAQARDALEQAQLDDLTGVYALGFGRAVLRQQIDSSRRRGARLVLGYCDVEGVHERSEELGHAAGDAMVVAAAAAIRRGAGSAPVLRAGGDAFICALAGVDSERAERIFSGIQAEFAAAEHGGRLSFGLSTLRSDDSLDTLIERGDGALREAKRRRP